MFLRIRFHCTSSPVFGCLLAEVALVEHLQSKEWPPVALVLAMMHPAVEQYLLLCNQLCFLDLHAMWSLE